jgi:hypothetical protein
MPKNNGLPVVKPFAQSKNPLHVNAEGFLIKA